MFVVILLLAVFTFCYYLLIKPVTYWKSKGVPQYGVYQVWKNTLTTFVRPEYIAYDLQKMYNYFSNFRYCGIYQCFYKTLLVRDLDLIIQITVKDFDHFVDHTPFGPANSEPLVEKNLFMLKGDEWKNMRNILTPSYTSSKMKMMFNLMAECSNQFVEYFEETVRDSQTVTFDVKDAFIRLANDVIASTAFGVTCNSLKDRDNEFFVMGRNLTQLQGIVVNLKFFILFAMPALAKVLGISMFPTVPKEFLRKIIKESIKIREEKGIVRQDMIQLLMEARDKVEKETEQNKDKFTIEHITAQAFIFFFAGFDGISSVMCFMAHELAVNPEVQHRLQAEIDKTSKQCNGNISYDTLSKLKYMSMVISESLRKWPSVVKIDRICTKPYTIAPTNDKEKPVVLNKGDVVWIPLHTLHRDPAYFSNPDRFDPERFNEDNVSNIVPFSYFPFGSGPRSCIANRFALMEMKLVFFHLLQKFDLVVVDKTQISLKLVHVAFQTNVEGGFWLGLKRRTLK